MSIKEEYDVVADEDLETLVKKVNGMLTAGWDCTGDLLYANGLFIQPMLATTITEPSEDVERPTNEKVDYNF